MMPVFSYRATSLDGRVLEGAIEAADEQNAAERLKDSGVIPLKIAASGRGMGRKLGIRGPKGDPLVFTTQLAALLGAGLPLDRSLNILSEISETREMKAIVEAVLKSIREGSTFSDALQKHPRVFPKLYVNMVRAGEAGGVLDVILEKLNEFQESSKELKEHLFSSMIYPAVLFGTGCISIVIILTFVLPKFSVIFAELGTALPLPTQILLAVSGGLQAWWWAAVLAIGGGWLFLRSYLKTAAGRYQWDAMKLYLLRDVITKLETARFCRTLGTLLRSGVSLLPALSNARDVITNRVIASALTAVSKGAKEGKGIGIPLADAHIFPPLALSMIKVGEETGQLDTMLLRVASTYEKSLREAIKRFVSLLDPVMILGMGLVIGFIVVSMLMAIFSVSEIPM